MEKKSSQSAKHIGGIAAQKIIIPIIIVFALLHISIIYLILEINTTSSSLSQSMRDYDEYVSDATSLQADSSLRCETSNTFVLMPVAEEGELNLHPLISYAEELSQNRLGSQVAERFQGYNVGKEAKDFIAVAAENSDSMYRTQLHALALMNAVYPLPKEAPFTDIALDSLSAEEEKLSDEQKLSAARKMILGREYSQNKQAVSKSVSAAVGSLRAESGQRAGQISKQIAMFRMLLWIVTLLIIFFMSVTFIVLYNQLLMPLDRFVRLIDSDHSLNEEKGLHEVRLLASAYNDLMWRRDALDEILRSAAETDTLTNLPNRYKYEQYLVEFGKNGYSLAVFLFDINFLKATNDKLGHSAGDILIKSAADCISTCFDLSATDIQGESFCFRFGGDEFAVLVKDCTAEGARELADRFEEEQKRRKISVSGGYAYTDDISKTTFKELMDEADVHMYEQKEEKHKQDFQFTVPANMMG